MSKADVTGVDLFKVEEKGSDMNYKRSLMNYFLSMSGNSRKEFNKIEDILFGKLNNEDYKWLLNPFNAKDERFKRFPGTLKNYDIILPIIRRFIGEHIKSYNSFHVTSSSPDEQNSFLEEFNTHAGTLIGKKIQAKLAKTINEMNKEQGVDSSEIPYSENDAEMNIEAELEKFKLHWKDNRAIIDANILEFIKATTDDAILDMQIYLDWIIYGQYFIDRYIEFDDLKKEIVHPQNAYPVYTNSFYVDDFDGFVISYKYTLSEVITKFRKKLKKTDKDYIKKLKDNYYKSGSRNVDTKLLKTHFGAELSGIENFETTILDVAGNIDCHKLYFKAFKEIKLLTYLDVFGEEQITEVESDYELNEEFGDIKIENEYIPRVYVMYRFGDDKAGIYTDPEELEVQRNSLNNPAECKIPVTGKIRIAPGLPNHSIPLTLEPYQKLINILYLSRERAIAKNHGKIGFFPKGLFGADDVEQDEQMYYMTAMGFAFPDESIPNASVALNGLKQIDLSDQGYIDSLSRLIVETKELANDLVDMNRQRAGDTYASDGKYTTQQAIIRSSLGSAIINETFNVSKCKDYEADIDFAKVAWKEGKRGRYIGSDRRNKFFEVNPVDVSERFFGIVVDNSLKNNENIDKLQDIAMGAAQNGEFDIAVEAIETENISKLKEILLKFQRINEERSEKAAKNEQAISKQEVDSKVQEAKLKEDAANARNTEDNETKLKIKQIDLEIEKLQQRESPDNDLDRVNIIEDLKSEINTLRNQLAEA